MGLTFAGGWRAPPAAFDYHPTPGSPFFNLLLHPLLNRIDIAHEKIGQNTRCGRDILPSWEAGQDRPSEPRRLAPPAQAFCWVFRDRKRGPRVRYRRWP